MAGQLPPEVLEDLMLVEAVNAPAPPAGEGMMPGGFADFGINDEGFAQVNVIPQHPGPAIAQDMPPPPFLRDVRGEEGQEEEPDTEDEGEEEEDSEEEDISVRTLVSFLFFLDCISDLFLWCRT